VRTRHDHRPLCGEIISSQKREIEQLKTIMARQ